MPDTAGRSQILEQPDVIIRPYRFSAPAGGGAAYTETFDVTGYDLGTSSPGGWTEVSGTPDEDNTTSIGSHMSGNTLLSINDEQIQLIFTEGAQSTVYIRLKIKVVTTDGFARFIEAGDSGDEDGAFYVRFQGTGAMRAFTDAGNDSDTSTDTTFGDEYVWIKYTTSTVGGFELKYGTSSVKASADDTLTCDTGTQTIDRIKFGFDRATTEIQLDDIEIDFSTEFGDF